jgi:hypothetical protein
VGDGADTFDDHELVVATIEMLRGSHFGLERHLTWGVNLARRAVQSYDDKRAVVHDLVDYARDLGVRRQVLARVETTADELLMNALYDAPADGGGGRAALQRRGRPGDEPVSAARVEVCYGSDGRRLGLAVQDAFGRLRKAHVVEHLVRPGAGPRVAIRDAGDGGAGLGLFFVAGAATQLRASVAPGVRTEVVALFDLRATEPSLRARSVGVLTAP